MTKGCVLGVVNTAFLSNHELILLLVLLPST